MQRLRLIVKQLIQLLLIVYVGIIGPLIYVKPHSPHDVGATTYALSIFQDASQTAKLADLRQLLNNANHPLPFASNHSDFPSVISDNVSIPSLTLVLQSLLSDLLVASGNNALALPLFPFYAPTDDTLFIHGVDLPLPKKPPTLV